MDISSDKPTRLHSRWPEHDREKKVSREKRNFLKILAENKDMNINYIKLILCNSMVNVGYMNPEMKRLITL